MFHTNVPGDVLDTFELIGVHFAHVFYNELYGHAKNKFANQGGPSITSVYQDIMVYYHRQMTVQSKVWTNNTITHIKLKFQQFSEIKLLTPTETIIYIADAFLPVKYVNEVAGKDKYDIVYSCLGNLVGELINEIVSNYLKMIIDDHDNKHNIGTLKDIIVGMLMQIRENLHSKFTKEEIGETRINVDVATAKRMREDINKSKKMISKLQEKSMTNDKHISQMENDIQRKDAAIVRLEKSNSELTADNSKHRRTILQLITRLEDADARAAIPNNFDRPRTSFKQSWDEDQDPVERFKSSQRPTPSFEPPRSPPRPRSPQRPVVDFERPRSPQRPIPSFERPRSPQRPVVDFERPRSPQKPRSSPVDDLGWFKETEAEEPHEPDKQEATQSFTLSDFLMNGEED